MNRPNYREIHRLEYELGLRDDPPSIEGFKRLQPTDAPGVIIDYDSRLLNTPAGQAALDREVADARRRQGEGPPR